MCPHIFVSSVTNEKSMYYTLQHLFIIERDLTNNLLKNMGDQQNKTIVYVSTWLNSMTFVTLAQEIDVATIHTQQLLDIRK